MFSWVIRGPERTHLQVMKQPIAGVVSLMHENGNPFASSLTPAFYMFVVRAQARAEGNKGNKCKGTVHSAYLLILARYPHVEIAPYFPINRPIHPNMLANCLGIYCAPDWIGDGWVHPYSVDHARFDSNFYQKLFIIGSYSVFHHLGSDLSFMRPINSCYSP